MQCVFLMRKGKSCYCEVFVDRYRDARQLPSSWVCETAWETLCPLYHDVMHTEHKRADDEVREPPVLHSSRIGHFNRIGGYRLLSHNRI